MVFIDCNEQITASKSAWTERPHCEHGKWVSSGNYWKSPKANRKYVKTYQEKFSKKHLSYRRKRAHNVYNDRKEWAIKYLGGVCANCGTPANDEMGALEFDHIRPETKEFVITRRLGSAAKETLLLELDKCQLLHAECHKAKTAQERGQSATAKQDQLEALINQHESEAA